MCGPAIPALSPLSHTSPGAGGQERLRASVVEVLEMSQAEQESRKSGARGTLNFSELRQREVRRIYLLGTSVNRGRCCVGTVGKVLVSDLTRALPTRGSERAGGPSPIRCP